jgi:hypothetical protein
MNRYELHHGDNLEVMRTMPDNSVDAIVTDPPAGIGFMGKEWDKDKGGRDAWVAWMTEVGIECRRLLKPGGHALVWSLPRTCHWTAWAWENAGFEPRDSVLHIFGSGFPKSLNISKQLNKEAGIDFDVVDLPFTDEANQWEGWGTALKPAYENWWLFRKPIEKGLTIAQNVVEHRVGGINIDGCRVHIELDEALKSKDFRTSAANNKGGNIFSKQVDGKRVVDNAHELSVRHNANGRFPANLTHDGSESVVAIFPNSNHGSFPKKTGVKSKFFLNIGAYKEERQDMPDFGSAARFFYCAKATQQDKEEGLEGFGEGNIHPTIKSTELMRYLCRLITPPNGIVFDPFMGSGSTGKAATIESFRFIGIEQNAEYLAIAKARIDYATKQGNLF